MTLLDRQALADLGVRGRTDWFYFIFINGAMPLFDPRILRLKVFACYTVLNVFCCIVTIFYLRDWMGKIAKSTIRSAQGFTVLKIFLNANLACMVGALYVSYGIGPLTSLATLTLVAFAQATIITLRTNLRTMRIALCCCLFPAVMCALWVGGRPGYGTALLLSAEAAFLWAQGKRENREYFRDLHQTQELVRARRRATHEGARIGDALLANAARHTATVAERNRIAYEWHDTLLAGFSAISWQLDEAVRRQQEQTGSVGEAIALARNMVHHYRTEARLAIADLMCEESETNDIVALIREHVPKLIGTRAIALSVDVGGKSIPLPPDTTRQLLRICEEAVNNSVHHGSPTSIRISLGFSEGRVNMSIADDGCGFISNGVPPGHFGLQIMRQRTHRLGGTFSLESEAGRGTTVSVTVPNSADFNMTPTRILVIEDQYFSRLALHTVIDSHSDMKIVGESDTGAAGLALFQLHLPDVTIIDLKLPDQSGIEVIKAIRKLEPTARIVMLSNFEGSEFLHRATEAGAMAYLTKDSDADELLLAIRAVRVGQSFIPTSLLNLLESRVAGNDLTVREQGVLELLVLGWNNKQIAERLEIAEKTVRIHMSTIFSKLGVANRTQAVLIALQRGFVDPGLNKRPKAMTDRYNGVS